MAVKINAAKPSVTVYRFGTTTDGNASMKNELGGKGANLAEMAALGVSVPPGFTIPCSASVQYKKIVDNGATLAPFLENLWEQVSSGVEYISKASGHLPLVSVRSGARVSMPGMMDTILNVGLTTDTFPAWATKLGVRAARDSYRRLVQMYSSVALGVPSSVFENIMVEARKAENVSNDAELSAEALHEVIVRYLDALHHLGIVFPNTFEEQLRGAILAVFKSWDNQRAKDYRALHNIPESWGTAVNIQSMVFGNLNDKSATGVLFTRDPANGDNLIVGEYLVNAQGEDVVAGIRTPLPLANMEEWNPDVLGQIVDCVSTLEAHYQDMQDVEFTIQDGTPYFLQTRSGKRTATAAVKIAHDLAMEEVIGKDVALSRVDRGLLLKSMQASIDPAFTVAPGIVGIAGGGGVVTGVAVFSSSAAINCTQPCILVREETDPDDLMGMNASVGILTRTGGLTSHAAVVARSMNKACVVGATDLLISGDLATMPSGSFKLGDWITVDGETGRVWAGIKVPLLPGGLSPEASALIKWAMQKAGDVSQRLELGPTMSQDEVIAAVASIVAPKVYIDTALVEGPYLSTIMFWLGDALKSVKSTEVVVDMASLQEHLSAPDWAFDRVFGADTGGWAQSLERKVDALVKWSPSLLSMVVVRLPDVSTPTSRQKLLKHGVVVCLAIATVADLLDATGPVRVPVSVLDKVFGGQDAYNALIKMLEESGRPVVAAAQSRPTYWYELLTGGV